MIKNKLAGKFFILFCKERRNWYNLQKSSSSCLFNVPFTRMTKDQSVSARFMFLTLQITLINLFCICIFSLTPCTFFFKIQGWKSEVRGLRGKMPKKQPAKCESRLPQCHGSWFPLATDQRPVAAMDYNRLTVSEAITEDRIVFGIVSGLNA